MSSYSGIIQFSRDLFSYNFYHYFSSNAPDTLQPCVDLSNASAVLDNFGKAFGLRFIQVFKKQLPDLWDNEEDFMRYVIPRCSNLVEDEHRFFSFMLVASFIRQLQAYLVVLKKCYRFTGIAYKTLVSVFERRFPKTFDEKGGLDELAFFCNKCLEDLNRPFQNRALSLILTGCSSVCREHVFQLIEDCDIVCDGYAIPNPQEIVLIKTDDYLWTNMDGNPPIMSSWDDGVKTYQATHEYTGSMLKCDPNVSLYQPGHIVQTAGIGATGTGEAAGVGATATGEAAGVGATATGEAAGVGATATGEAAGVGAIATSEATVWVNMDAYPPIMSFRDRGVNVYQATDEYTGSMLKYDPNVSLYQPGYFGQAAGVGATGTGEAAVWSNMDANPPIMSFWDKGVNVYQSTSEYTGLILKCDPNVSLYQPGYFSEAMGVGAIATSEAAGVSTMATGEAGVWVNMDANPPIMSSCYNGVNLYQATDEYTGSMLTCDPNVSLYQPGYFGEAAGVGATATGEAAGIGATVTGEAAVVDFKLNGIFDTGSISAFDANDCTIPLAEDHSVLVSSLSGLKIDDSVSESAQNNEYPLHDGVLSKPLSENRQNLDRFTRNALAFKKSVCKTCNRSCYKIAYQLISEHLRSIMKQSVETSPAATSEELVE